MGRSSAQGNSTGLPGESRWRTKASVIAREQFLSTFGQCNDSIISSWLGSAATAEQIERIAQANRRTISSFGEPDRHCTRTRGCKAVAQAAQAWMATSNRFSGAPRKHWCCAGGLVSEPHFSEHCIGEDVHRGKPDPDVYLLAASRVGVAAERCIVVEDASAGIEGGRRTGMRTLG